MTTEKPAPSHPQRGPATAKLPAGFPKPWLDSAAVSDNSARTVMWRFINALHHGDITELSALAAETVLIEVQHAGKTHSQKLRGDKIRQWLSAGALLSKFDPTGSALTNDSGKALAPQAMDACAKQEGPGGAFLRFGCAGDFLTDIRWVRIRDGAWRWTAVVPVSLR